jgi:hypothetical protein
MQVRMVVERLSPGVEESGDADVGAEVLGIGGDGEQGRGGPLLTAARTPS